MSYPQLLQDALHQGLSLDRALALLRASGASPIEAAAAVQQATGVSMEDARSAVTRSRAWSGPRSGMQPLGAGHPWYGAIGRHGRSGHGASSVLPHLVRQTQGHAQVGKDQSARR